MHLNRTHFPPQNMHLNRIFFPHRTCVHISMGYIFLWGTYFYGIRISMGYVFLWGTYFYGVCISMGYVLLWGTYFYGVRISMGYIFLWGTYFHGVRISIIRNTHFANFIGTLNKIKAITGLYAIVSGHKYDWLQYALLYRS